MAKKKLSPAQETLQNLLQGKTLTYRIVSNAPGHRSILDTAIDGKKPDFRIALATIEALINSGHAILKSVNIYGNIHTVVLSCDNHATVPAQHETLSALKAENAELKAERKEIEMRQRTAGYTVDSDRRLTVIGSKKRELYSKAAYILMTTCPDEIEDAKFAHHVVDIARLNCSGGQPERDFWDDQKTWWGCEIKRRREAPKAQVPIEAAEVEAHEVEATEAEAQVSTEAPAIKAVWPLLKAMSKYGYAIVRVTGSAEHAAGYNICYRVLDYKSASLVGLYPATVGSYRTINEAFAAMDEVEKIDSDMPRASRACKIRQARLGLRQTKAPEAHMGDSVQAAEYLRQARHREALPLLERALLITQEIGDRADEVSDAETLAETEAITRYLIASETDDSVHRHTLGTVLLAQGKKDEAVEVFLALYESYRHDNQLQEAKQPLWEIILNCPGYAGFAYTLLGKICEDLQQYPSAIVVYTHASNCIGGNEDSLYGLHRVCLAMGKEAKAQEYLEQARKMADEREIAMGRCIPVPVRHEEAPALSRETADAIEQRHNVIVDCASEMYTDNYPCSTNDYGETGWQLIPQKWIDEVTTQS